MLPWLGKAQCELEACGFKHTCFDCEYGFAGDTNALFSRYNRYSAGLVASDNSD